MGNLELDLDSTPAVNMDFDPLPDGRYLAQVSESSVVANSSGTGLLLKLTFDILDDAYKGRKVWAQLNIRHPNEKAQQIGRGQAAALCRACGKVGLVDDSSEIHEVPVVVKLKTEKSEGYNPKNVITGFYPTTTTTQKKESGPAPAVSNGASFDDDELPF